MTFFSVDSPLHAADAHLEESPRGHRPSLVHPQSTGACEAPEACSIGEGLSDTLKAHRRELQDYLDGWSLRQDEILAGVSSCTVTCGTNADDAGVASAAFFSDAGAERISSVQSLQVGSQPISVWTPFGSQPPSWLVSPQGLSVAVQMLGGSEDSGLNKPAGIAATKLRRITMLFGQVDPKTKWRVVSVLARIERSMAFEFLCAAVIVANTVALALCSQGQVEQISDSCGTQLETAELVFSFFYLVELCLRIFVYRAEFVLGADWKWNCLDFFLVATAIHEQVTTKMLENGNEGTNLSYLRLARMAKMLKLLRILRIVRAFRELRLVMNSILGSMKSMIWSVVFVVTIMFMFGICFVQATAQYLIENHDDEATSQLRAKALHYWGSIALSIRSLWTATTGGDDWQVMASVLQEMGVLYYLLFVSYVGFFLFVVTNVLTSLFIDAAVQYAERDQHQVIQAQLAQKKQYSQRIIQLYKQMDRDQDGQISQEEFNSNIKDERLTAFAASLDIDTVDLQQFFAILSSGGTRKVDLDTFVVGCIKLRGSAKAMDLIELMLRQRSEEEKAQGFRKFCQEEIKSVNVKLSTLANSVGSVRGAINMVRTDIADLSRAPSVAFSRDPSVAVANGEHEDDREGLLKESL